MFNACNQKVLRSSLVPQPQPTSPLPLTEPDIRSGKVNQTQPGTLPVSSTWSAFSFLFACQSELAEAEQADITLITLTKIPLNLEKFWTLQSWCAS